MGVSLGRVEPISGFFEAGRLTVAELGERLVDLGGFSCRCSNDDFRREVLDYMLDIANALGEGGEYTLPVVIAEVRVRGVNGFVQSGIVCIAPSCICEAIRELWRTDRDLANHVKVAVSPLKKVYDLTKPSEEVELRAAGTTWRLLRQSSGRSPPQGPGDH